MPEEDLHLSDPARSQAHGCGRLARMAGHEYPHVDIPRDAGGSGHRTPHQGLEPGAKPVLLRPLLCCCGRRGSVSPPLQRSFGYASRGLRSPRQPRDANRRPRNGPTDACGAFSHQAPRPDWHRTRVAARSGPSSSRSMGPPHGCQGSRRRGRDARAPRMPLRDASAWFVRPCFSPRTCEREYYGAAARRGGGVQRSGASDDRWSAVGARGNVGDESSANCALRAPNPEPRTASWRCEPGPHSAPPLAVVGRAGRIRGATFTNVVLNVLRVRLRPDWLDSSHPCPFRHPWGADSRWIWG